MPSRKKIISNDKNLIRRYLVWCYKTTKESLDRVDRKFTQLTVDDYILGQLRVTKTETSKISEFEQYIAHKKNEAVKEKFSEESRAQLNPAYQYFQNRFEAIEKAIVHFLGKAELKSIEKLYEEEMTQRILQAREHS